MQAEARIAQLARAVREGTYSIDLLALAAAMLADPDARAQLGAPPLADDPVIH